VDSRWFRDEVLPHEAALRSYLQGRVARSTDVDDVVQESYARLLRAELAGKIAEVRPYLFAIARNAAHDCFRRDSRRAEEPLSELAGRALVEERPDAAEVASQNQELSLLSEAIAALPERCREVFTLRKLHNLSQREIAERLGLSEHTVERQITLGLHRCRHFLRSRGIRPERLKQARLERSDK